MFESKSGLLSPPEVIVRFDEMFERPLPVDDRPAHDCDLDHTIPYANGGPTRVRIWSATAAPT
jgi:hypothetical protein